MKTNIALLLLSLAALLVTLCTSLGAESRADSWLEKGQELGRNGSYEEAVKAYDME